MKDIEDEIQHEHQKYKNNVLQFLGFFDDEAEACEPFQPLREFLNTLKILKLLEWQEYVWNWHSK